MKIKDENTITKEILSNAEKIIGLNFSDKQREDMIKGVNSFLSNYKKQREIKFNNNNSPPLYFNPQISAIKYDNMKKPIKISKILNVELPSNFEEISFYSITQLAWLLKNQKITSLELTKLYLKRLKKYDPILKCVITLTDEIALKQAEIADKEISNGKYRGTLHGIPYGIKDAFSYPDIPTTWGALPYKNQIINETATVIKRLEDTGAVLLAKLSMGSLGSDHIWFGGKTPSPWNLGYDAGGSSSGSAAATASGLVGFSLGTETWGSIIQPSDHCGVTGLRPTYGRVSRFGVMTLAWSMDKIGPICRTVEDCAIVFSTIYGPDRKDMAIKDIPFNWDGNQPIND
ncbi:MAG: amidase [Candidatus Hodarchaeales archaeon]|jgi:Asp-tRNA(Asn)/Glu-tRNA(Gln) amidotransferase A subunit family amidase